LAAVDDLIAQIEDEALRDRLRTEVDRLTREKRFGLVFEEHLPELTPIYSAPIREGNRVARRDASLTDVWRVLSVDKEQALCLNPASSKRRRMPTDDLVVVRRFGEPIFPALTPVDRVQNGPDDAPWHTLIEADNYHALQLLEYLYTGQVDCIYIDPPYNTGARDWKYNNDYVDSNDRWRHSKWLAMMRRRLVLAKRLLNPQTGVLIVTIDEHEVHHLRMLLEAVFPETFLQMVTAVTNPKGVSQRGFSRVDEYVVFCFMEEAAVTGGADDYLTPVQHNADRPRWASLLRSGNNARRQDRKNMFFPVHIDTKRMAVVGTGVPMLEGDPVLEMKPNGSVIEAWPIRSDKSLGNWGVGHETLRKLIKKGYVRVGGYDDKRGTWTIYYLNKKLRDQIDEDKLRILEFDEGRNCVDVQYVGTPMREIRTVWHRTRHDAGAYGSDHLGKVIGKGKFTFPKSIYAVRDALITVVRNKKDAIILDFFAGSGTTLDAVNLLNCADDGARRCILVTNNEVSEEQAKVLSRRDYQPGDGEWERHGICRSVTWPRVKCTILGQRDDGAALEREYLTGNTVSKEKARTFRHLGYIAPDALSTAAHKKEIVSLIEGIPMSHIKPDTAFFASDDERHTAAILFDDTQGDAFLDALEEMDHITHFYIVTGSNKLFQDLRAQITDLLGPIEVQEEETRPMREGFPANLEYLKLDFVEKDQVALGRQFRAILPLLWLRAGAVGPRPELTEDDSIPAMLLPANNLFAVLIDETRFADFQAALAARDDLTHVFLITDSEEAFHEMAAQLTAPHVLQLYRDYLENFAINRGDVS